MEKVKVSFLVVLLSLAIVSCQDEMEITKLQDESGLSPCLGDEDGNPCDTDLPIGGGDGGTGSNTGNSDTILTRFQYFYPGRNTSKSSSKLYSSYSNQGTGFWTGEFTVANGTKTETKVGAIQVGSKVFLVHRGRTSDKLYCAISTNGVDFSTNYTISNAETKGYPALVEFNGEVWVFHRGKNSSRIFASSTQNGINWTNSTSISVEAEYDNYTVIAKNNPAFNPDLPISSSNRKHLSLHLFAEGANVYHYSSEDGINFSNRQIIPSTAEGEDGIRGITSTKIEREDVNGGTKYVYYVAYTDDRVDNIQDIAQIRIFSTEDFNLYSAVSIISVDGGNIFTDTDPSLATDGSKLVLVYKEARGERIYYSYSYDGLNWSGNRPAKGSTKSGVELLYTQ